MDEPPLSPDGRTSPRIVTIDGDIDIASTPALREHLRDVLNTREHARVIIDLSGVHFCDASGLGLLIGAQRHARRLRTSLCLSGPQPPVLRLLHVTGLDRSLEIHATLAAAIDAGPVS